MVKTGMSSILCLHWCVCASCANMHVYALKVFVTAPRVAAEFVGDGLLLLFFSSHQLFKRRQRGMNGLIAGHAGADACVQGQLTSHTSISQEELWWTTLPDLKSCPPQLFQSGRTHGSTCCLLITQSADVRSATEEMMLIELH